MPSNILKFIDYDEDTAHFESFNNRIHIITTNEDQPDGVTVSIDQAAAHRLVDWLSASIEPNSFYTNPTRIEELD